MKKSVWVLCTCFICCLCPQLVQGQVDLDYGQSFLSQISNLDLKNIRLVPSVKVGYQKTAINLSFPVVGQAPAANSWLHSLDVKFNNTNFWVGSLGLDLLVGPRAGLFLEVSASPARRASVTTNFAGVAAGESFGGNGWMEWNWPTFGSQWWEVNAQGRIAVTEQWSFLAGFKVDRLNQKLSAPPEPSYRGLIYPGPTYIWPLLQDYFGDVNLTTYCPYVGIRVGESWWDFSLIWSPWLTSYNVQMPLRIVFHRFDSFAFDPFFYAFVTGNIENKFSLRGSNGQLFEAFGQVKSNVLNNIDLTVWLKGSWLQCRGAGVEESIAAILIYGEGTGVGPFRYYGAFADTGDAASVYTRYLWSVGVSSQLSF